MHGEPGAVLASYISLQSHQEKGKKSSCGEEDGSGGEGRGEGTPEPTAGAERGGMGREDRRRTVDRANVAGDGEKTRLGEA